MNKTVEQFCEALVEARIGERFHFAVKSCSRMPHYFHIQKVRLVDSGECDLFVITDDEGFRERVYNWYKYLGPCGPYSFSEKVDAAGQILLDYLAWYNEDYARPAPLDLSGAAGEAGVSAPMATSAAQFGRFMAMMLTGIDRF